MKGYGHAKRTWQKKIKIQYKEYFSVKVLLLLSVSTLNSIRLLKVPYNVSYRRPSVR